MRLIDADKADVNFINTYYSDHCRTDDVQEWLDEQPTIEAKPVVHGKWEIMPCGPVAVYGCSVCGEKIPFGKFPDEMKYCPVCGADMRERKENK